MSDSASDSSAGHSNQMTGADALVRMLQAHNVTHMFGLCGDTTLPFYDSLSRLDHGITHILTRDERHAGYMADGYARVTGKPGVCEGPSGGGATYILPGVVEANESSIPILAITTDVATTSRGKYPLTELDQEALFRPLTKWNASLDDASRLPAMVRKAFRSMTTGTPGAAHLALPFNTQKATLNPDEVWADERHGSFPAEPRMAPDPAAISAAAEALIGAKRAVAVCGGGPVISGAEAELRALAGLFNMPISTTVSGQGSVAETDPLAVGVVGSNGASPATKSVVDEADLVLFIGCRAGSVTTERWRSPKPGTPIIHIDSDPEVIGANYATEVAINADAKLALAALVKELLQRSDLPDFDGAARAATAWTNKLAAFEPLANSSETPIRPERVIATLQHLLPQDAVIVADPGTPCPYFSAHYRWPPPGATLSPTGRMAHWATPWRHRWVPMLAVLRLRPWRLWVMALSVSAAESLKPSCVTTCRSLQSCFQTQPMAGSKPVRIPALENATTMLISTAPITPPSPAHSAFVHGRCASPLNWRLR